ncbi:MAG: TRAP transporter substrate-binding protein DctP [Chloroflexota bacterium]
MKTKKLVLFAMLSSIIAIVMIVSACTAPSTSPTGTEPTETEEETIELTFGGLWPPNHPFSEATKQWIEKIEEETNGRVQIEPFWGGALYGPGESATELAKGVADIGDYSGAYAKTGFDFEKSMRMAFWGVYEEDTIIEVWEEVRAKFPELNQEHEDAGIKVMCWGPIPPYQLITVGKAVRSADDFQGLMLKTTGDFSKVASKLNAEGTTISMGDTYTALQKNTIDGGFVPYETLGSFKFAEVADYVTELNIASAPAGHWGMDMDVFNDLPEDIQQVFVDNVDWFSNKVGELAWGAEQAGKDLAKEEGVEFITLPQEELDAVYAACDEIASAEMADLDDQGLPGSAVYQEVRTLIEEYK